MGLVAPETNSKFAPENGFSPGKEDSYWKPSFLGAFAVSFRDCFFFSREFSNFLNSKIGPSKVIGRVPWLSGDTL